MRLRHEGVSWGIWQKEVSGGVNWVARAEIYALPGTAARLVLAWRAQGGAQRGTHILNELTCKFCADRTYSKEKLLDI